MTDEPDMDLTNMSKRQIKKKYLAAEFGLSDAIPALMSDHGMERGEALKYLGL